MSADDLLILIKAKNQQKIEEKKLQIFEVIKLFGLSPNNLKSKIFEKNSEVL